MIKVLILINLAVVVIWDIFRAPQTMADGLAELLTKGKIHSITLRKPFGCSLCITFWISLVITYLFCERSLEGFLVATLLSLLNAYMTKYTYQFISLTEKIIDKIIYNINSKI